MSWDRRYGPLVRQHEGRTRAGTVAQISQGMQEHPRGGDKMLSQQVLTLDHEDKKIILALLLHPRLIGIRRQFQDRVSEVLGDDRELERISQVTQLPVNELVSRTRRMLGETDSDVTCQPDVFGQTADTALTFFASPTFINVWGHFTMALQKIMLDDLTVGEVAASCGASDLGQVRSAIRQFSTESGNDPCHTE